ncbi:MAG TPA: N-acetylornithine carbamoyltransferase [Pirellulaceae bacterium]|nr:N-acetylornithine carbamoyltransferase [Pirellulaceae bacterium]HMO92475.1 N-acetylornithine carbamoyltransferase [Pirellulaceae bacterium]HMP67855.1 N-acetylornithine carbamoyltransferase [Pirellulaceae bacterium]
MKHFLTTQDWSRAELQQILELAGHLKKSPFQSTLHQKSIALLFLNSSMRTRTSFQLGAHQLGGLAIVLQPGKDAWPIEFNPGVTMDGEAEEHISEVAEVLSRYCDLIALRAFPKFQDWSKERTDPIIKALAKHASVPVINMETIVHPCQEMAMMLTIQEHFGRDLSGKNFLLTWTWHPKPLNTAVANSAILMASKFGMNVRLLIPSEAYLLDEQFMQSAKTNASDGRAAFDVFYDIETAYANADFVYAKSWGAIAHIGHPESEWELRKDQRHFIVDQSKMSLTNSALFSHCLPLRRNIKATDEVMDASYCVAIQEAENRLHVQKAIMSHLVSL